MAAGETGGPFYCQTREKIMQLFKLALKATQCTNNIISLTFLTIENIKEAWNSN